MVSRQASNQVLIASSPFIQHARIEVFDVGPAFGKDPPTLRVHRATKTPTGACAGDVEAEVVSATALLQ
ncbi:hypothetical protein W823_23495 [Williamsia sp. D3]|nr:hypothetical protein W823_23495 [Williamsia sp. D3]